MKCWILSVVLNVWPFLSNNANSRPLFSCRLSCVYFPSHSFHRSYYKTMTVADFHREEKRPVPEAALLLHNSALSPARPLLNAHSLYTHTGPVPSPPAVPVSQTHFPHCQLTLKHFRDKAEVRSKSVLIHPTHFPSALETRWQFAVNMSVGLSSDAEVQSTLLFVVFVGWGPAVKLSMMVYKGEKRFDNLLEAMRRHLTPKVKHLLCASWPWTTFIQSAWKEA